MAKEYRVTTFGQPRSEWQPTYRQAMRDARRMELASYDEARRQWFLAVPVAIESRGQDDLLAPLYPTHRPRLRAPWSAEEIATVQQIARSGDMIYVAWHHSGRSLKAVRNKAKQLGLGFRR